MAIINLTSDIFEDEVILYNKGLVLVDFWATWCVPCKQMDPILEEISKEYTNVKICKVNIDDCNDIVFKYRVTSVPTMLFFKNGVLVANPLVGTRPKNKLIEHLNILLQS